MKRKSKKQTGENRFISPLDNNIVRAIFGDQKNIRNAEALLKPIIGVPPEEYATMRVVPPTLFRRWHKDKEGILDMRYIIPGSGPGADRTIHIEVQINPFKAMIARILYYQARMLVDQIHSGESFDHIHQVISVVLLDYNLLPGEQYMRTFEFCDTASGESFTALQKIVIIELKKLPQEDDGTAAWPHLRFFTCKTEEEMAMLVYNHPEVGGAAREYRRLTMLERVRMLVDDMNDARRLKKAREDYVREEGREKGERSGYDKASAEYQGQLSVKDEQIRQLEAEVRRLRGE
jgi:predicted transposase/invertase (TIGR01784 family)